MPSYRQIYYHIVFGTKYRKQTIPESHCDTLYRYIAGIIKNKNCKPYQINGAPDHIHIMSDLHPSVALADYIKTIKVSSSIWMKTQPAFNQFEGWAEKYAAFTVSHKDRERVFEYIKRQKEHHRLVPFIDEFKNLLEQYGIEFDEKYLL
ncbi:MAG TPA: IS200/IS605 family transposase [Cyclobacteriaceae bacterium]|nr:IS200/IS605 family transposase [Cyclobacteriaceae bacterium]